MNHSTPGLPVHHQLLDFTQTHVHWVGDAIQSSHPLLSPSLPAPNPSQHQGLFQWVNSSHEVAKVLEFQLQRQSSTPSKLSSPVTYADELCSLILGKSFMRCWITSEVLHNLWVKSFFLLGKGIDFHLQNLDSEERLDGVWMDDNYPTQWWARSQLAGNPGSLFLKKKKNLLSRGGARGINMWEINVLSAWFCYEP